MAVPRRTLDQVLAVDSYVRSIPGTLGENIRHAINKTIARDLEGQLVEPPPWDLAQRYSALSYLEHNR